MKSFLPLSGGCTLGFNRSLVSKGPSYYGLPVSEIISINHVDSQFASQPRGNREVFVGIFRDRILKKFDLIVESYQFIT